MAMPILSPGITYGYAYAFSWHHCIYAMPMLSPGITVYMAMPMLSPGITVYLAMPMLSPGITVYGSAPHFVISLSRNCSSFLLCPGHSTLCLPVSVLDAAQGHCVSYYFIIMKFPGMSILFHPVYAAQGFPALLHAC